MFARAPFINSAAWSLAGRSIGIGGGFIVGICLARVMTPRDLGAFFVLQTTVVFLATIARGGLQQPIVKAVAEAHSSQQFGRAGETLKWSILIVLAIGSVLLPVLYVKGFDWLGKTLIGQKIPADVKIALCVWVGFLAVQTPMSEVLRGLSRIGSAVLADGALATVAVAIYLGVVLFSTRSLGLGEAVTAFSLAVLVGVVWSAICLFSVRRMLIGDGKQSLIELLGMARSTLLINIATLLFSSASIWICSALLSNESTAMYGVGTRLASLATIPLLVMNIAIQPYIAAMLAESRRRELEGLLQITALLAGVPAAVTTLVFIAFGTEILALIYGKAYIGAASTLTVLALGNLVNVFTGSCGQVLIFSGHARQFVILTVVSGAASILISLSLATRFDIEGVAIGQFFGVVGLNYFAWRYSRKVIGIRTHPKWDKRVLSLSYLKRRLRDS